MRLIVDTSSWLMHENTQPNLFRYSVNGQVSDASTSLERTSSSLSEVVFRVGMQLHQIEDVSLMGQFNYFLPNVTNYNNFQ